MKTTERNQNDPRPRSEPPVMNRYAPSVPANYSEATTADAATAVAAIDTRLLERAAEVVRDRQAKYGSPYEDMARVAKMWSAIFGIEVKPEQVPLAMECIKISRAVNGYQPDNAIDGCGYWQVYESCIIKEPVAYIMPASWPFAVPR